MTPNALPATRSRAKSKTTMMFSTLLVVFTMILAACGSSSQNNPGPTTKHVLTVASQSSDFSQAGLNLFNGHTDVGVQGLIYETLYFVNVNGGAFTPMLATGYSWNSDNTQLTFTIRQGVKWNDGKPFDANDVAFTFNLLKQYPAADANGVWSFLSSVTAPSATTLHEGLPTRTGNDCRTRIYRSAARLLLRRRPDQVSHRSPGRHRPIHRIKVRSEPGSLR